MQQENDQRLQSRASLSRERAELQTQRRDFIHETGISHLMLFLPLGVQLFQQAAGVATKTKTRT